MKKTALITGASSGIGMETAFLLAEKGYELVLVARRTERLEKIRTEIKEKFNSGVEIITKDLAVINSAEELHTELNLQGIKTDVLINNAGFGIKGEMLNSDSRKEEQMMILNMITLTKLTKLFAADMKSSGGGIIINIASTAAFQAVPNLGIYSATKAYVLSFSEAVAYELKKYNVKVISICPGATESEFAEVAGLGDKFRNMSIPGSKELAGFIYSSMNKNCPVAIHGFKNKLMIWSARFAPRQMVVSIAGRLFK
ncbi:MAG: SDR family NAD(P)-dependent oxidoreductase [Deltaproteobacteria bacterium]